MSAGRKPVMCDPLRVEALGIFANALDESSRGLFSLAKLMLDRVATQDSAGLMDALDAVRAYQQDLFNSLQLEIEALEDLSGAEATP